ncbi:MAG: hypothetical protein EOO73_15065 [Myxococcales bacterium]|nr:MAG: hypothetical protein EOO73_15065 [Myxococcales bacterium]
MGARPIHCALALASTLLAAPLARAAATPDSIPKGCGSRAAFDAELRARLGDDAPLAQVFVAIAPHREVFHLRVTVGEERRELEDASCDELFRAAIVIAVSMLLEESKSAPAAAPAPAASPAPPSRRTFPELNTALGAGLGLGTLPKPVLALELEAQARWRFFGVGANVRYLLPTERLDATQRGADLSALGAGVTGIFRPSPSWEARLGFAAQQLYGTGVGISRGYSAVAWAAGPTLGLGWAPLRQGRFWAGVGAEGQLNLARGRFEIRNYSGELNAQSYVVYRVPWLAAGGFLRFGLLW